MASLLKRKLDSMINDPVSKIFKNKGYDQNTDARKAQISFYKLLMILAYADDSVNEKEINLIKDYFYESSITEEEWREINFYSMNKPNQSEIQEIFDNVLTQIHKHKDKSEFINALKDTINADGILKDQEYEIMELLTTQISTKSIFSFKSILHTINKQLNKKHSDMNTDLEALDYVKNPIAPIMYELLGGNVLPNFEVASAKIGLAMIVIHSDTNFDAKEKEALKQFIKVEFKLDEEKLNEVFSKLLQIPESYFEMAYLSRIITAATDETERLKLLIELFNIARANQVYDDYEDMYLRLIAQFLFISNGDFLTIKKM
ncbi:MAG: TerB family tellurite resistance protein [bacterium]